jgi:hypothetical protein
MAQYEGQHLRKAETVGFTEHNARISSSQEVLQRHLTTNTSKVKEEFNEHSKLTRKALEHPTIAAHTKIKQLLNSSD